MHYTNESTGIFNYRVGTVKIQQEYIEVILVLIYMSVQQENWKLIYVEDKFKLS